jgi:hypothetical protein
LELALNIAWVIVAAAVLILCGGHALAFTERRRRITALIGLSCLIWLLFPVISITDDLHAEQAILERTAVRKVAPQNEVAKSFVAAPVPTALPLLQVTWREVNLSADLTDIEQEFFAFDLSRRPPPQSL